MSHLHPITCMNLSAFNRCFVPDWREGHDWLKIFSFPPASIYRFGDETKNNALRPSFNPRITHVRVCQGAEVWSEMGPTFSLSLLCYYCRNMFQTATVSANCGYVHVFNFYRKCTISFSIFNLVSAALNNTPNYVVLWNKVVVLIMYPVDVLWVREVLHICSSEGRSLHFRNTEVTHPGSILGGLGVCRTQKTYD